MRKFSTAFPALLLLCAGCSTTPPRKPEEKAPPEPVTGLHALAQMFSSARLWAADVQILRLTSLHVGDLKPQPGKATAWQATFVAPSLGQSRVYTFSAVDISTSIRQGTFPDAPVPFSARGQSAQPFPIAAARKDTDEVYQTALQHAKDYDGKHPGMIINYLLELNNRSPDALWRVIWGESASTSAFSVLVDASTGAFVGVLH